MILAKKYTQLPVSNTGFNIFRRLETEINRLVVTRIPCEWDLRSEVTIQ